MSVELTEKEIERHNHLSEQAAEMADVYNIILAKLNSIARNEYDFIRATELLDELSTILGIDINILVELNTFIDGAEIKYLSYTEKMKRNRFDVGNLQETMGYFGISSDIIVVTDVVVEENMRGEGVGNRALIKFCERNKDKFIITLNGFRKSNMVVNEDYTNIKVAEILKRQAKFIKRAGFIDITEIIGNEPYCHEAEFRELVKQNLNFVEYEFNYIYNNEKAANLLKQIDDVIALREQETKEEHKN